MVGRPWEIWLAMMTATGRSARDPILDLDAGRGYAPMS